MDLFSQTRHLLAITIPLGPNLVLLTGLHGREALSELFRFELELRVPRPLQIPFDKLLGQCCSIRMSLTNGLSRQIHGMVSSLSVGRQDDSFTQYRAELVPRPWLLQRRRGHRTFQQQTVPEIVASLLDGFDVSFELTADYPRRNFTVQYGESDFEFLSRLAEEEGIGYFFRFEQDRHEMVFFDHSPNLADLPEPATIVFDDVTEGVRDGVRIAQWEKTQSICSSTVTLWDHSFQLPDQNLEAAHNVPATVDVGVTEHRLPGSEEQLEIYEYPGGYARWFDGVDPGGTARPDDPPRNFEQNERIAAIRLQEQAGAGLELAGSSDCIHFVPGRKFSVIRHFHAEGKYLLGSVEHEARLQLGYRSSDAPPTLEYTNRFTCLPDQWTYRPARRTPRPRIDGVQTATVVGPEDGELFVDQYGRVKVQFHWDRVGERNGDSSCWIRVAQIWAGPNWGAFFWPRIGHEVVVAFVDGDPDRPLIVGSVYNARNMPPLDLPEGKETAGIKSKIFGGDPSTNFNSVLFHDAQGQEFLHLHSETHEMSNSEVNKYHYVPQGNYEFRGSF